MRSLSLLCSSALVLISTSGVAHADAFQVSYLGAGVQASSSSTYVENFNSASLSKSASNTYATTFGNSGITGTYTGGFAVVNADSYGGANGSGKYITTGPYTGSGTSYTLTLSQGVNYFGLWFSALDSANQLSFYNGNTLLYTFGAQQFISGVGTCPTSAYCGNPNNGADSGEQFAFINFYDSNGAFNKIVFTEPSTSSGGFESDNHTVANLASAPGGTSLAPVPEPSSLALLGTGISGIATLLRRRKR